MIVDVLFDGGSRGNPGPAAAAAIVRDVDGRTLRHVGRALDYATNNSAEWTGLLIGLEAARDVGATDVRVYGDSKLVVEQFSGNYSIREEHLRKLAMDVSSVARAFRTITVRHVRREFNRAPDAICNAVLDGTYIADAATEEEAISVSGSRWASAETAARVSFMVEVTMDPEDVARKTQLGRTLADIRRELTSMIEGKLRLAAVGNPTLHKRPKVDVIRVKG